MTDANYIELAGALMSPLGMMRLIKPDLRWSWFHEQIDAAMVGVVRHARRLPGGISHVVVNLPSQHAKSTIVSEATPAWAHGIDPALKIFSVAHNQDLAKRAIRLASRHIDHPGYHAAFNTRIGDVECGGQRVRAVRQAEHYETVSVASGVPKYAGGYYMSFGVGGGATGHACDLLITDDTVKGLAEALSDAHQTAVWDFILGQLEARRPRAQVAIATRWARGDPPERLANFWRDAGHDVLELVFPAKYERKLGRPYDHREEGEGLWLERYTQDEYDATERAMMRANPMLYRGQHQQDPMELGAKPFPREHFETFDPEDKRWSIRELDEVWISVDCNAKKDGGSFAVAAAWGVILARDCRTPVGYLRLDERRDQPEPSALNQMVRELCDKWSTLMPDQWRRAMRWVAHKDHPSGNPIIEAKAGGYAVQSALRGDYSCRMLPKAIDKPTAHALASSVMIPAGEERTCKVFVPSRAALGVTSHWVEDYLDEMASTGKPDDRRDETAQFLIVRDPSLGYPLLTRR